MMPSPLIATLSQSAFLAARRAAVKLAERDWSGREKANGRIVACGFVPISQWPALQAYFRAEGWDANPPHDIDSETTGVDRLIFKPIEEAA